MSSIISVMWFVLLVLSIIGSLRGWKVWPWIAICVPFAFWLYAENRASRTASLLSSWMLSLDREMMTWGSSYAMETIREEVERNNAITLFLQLVVLIVLCYFTFFLPENVQKDKAGFADPRGTDIFAIETQSSRLAQLDKLLQKSLIDGVEYEQRKKEIREEIESAHQKERVHLLHNQAHPYIARLQALETMFKVGLISEEERVKHSESVIFAMVGNHVDISLRK